MVVVMFVAAALVATALSFLLLVAIRASNGEALPDFPSLRPDVSPWFSA